MVENTPEKRSRLSAFEKEAIAQENFTDLFNELENIVPIDSDRRNSIYWVDTKFKRGRKGKAIVCLDYNFEPFDPLAASLFIWPQVRNGLMANAVIEMDQTVRPNPDEDFDFLYDIPEFWLKHSFLADNYDLSEVDAEDALFSLTEDRPSDEMIISKKSASEVQKIVGKIDINSLQKYF